MADTIESTAGPLERYISVLELIAAFPGELAAADVAHALQMPKSTTHRMLRVLSRSGLIEGGDYRDRALSLGNRLTRLVYAAGHADWIEAAVLPTLAQATSKFPNASVFVSRLAGHRVFVVASAASDPRWRSYVVPGQELPPHAAASAKVILAYQADDIVAAALNRQLEAFTRNTLTDKDAILHDLTEIRTLGYGVCDECIHEGMSALSVPIHIPVDGVIYSVGVTGPITRVIREDTGAVAKVLQDIAHALTPILSLRGRKSNGGKSTKENSAVSP
ncbi:MAG: IclR family transcriptional regulator [Hyphomicrobiales bacterium]|nr:IclR family transcriptional regulator [Hyphomicrobiales bacterium]